MWVTCQLLDLWLHILIMLIGDIYYVDDLSVARTLVTQIPMILIGDQNHVGYLSVARPTATQILLMLLTGGIYHGSYLQTIITG